MRVKRLLVGDLRTNCYIVCNDRAEAIIVDPGADADRIFDAIEKLEVTPVAIFLTHGHFDHILAVEAVKEKYGIRTYMSVLEKDFASDPAYNMSAKFDCTMSFEADEYLNDGDVVPVFDQTFRCISTPGHTPGGCCYYAEEAGLLFSGDTLFRSTVGRTDIKGGDFNQLIDSIKEKLLTLPDDTIVYPGHGFETTIEYEHSNPFLV